MKAFRKSSILFSLIFTLLLLALVQYSIWAQGYHRKGASATESIVFKGLTVTTAGTTVFENGPYLQIKYWVGDTLAADSAKVKLIIKASETTTASSFAPWDTLTLAVDSTWAIAYYTPTNHPMSPYLMFSCKGDSLTSKRYNKCQVRVDWWAEDLNSK
jgi:hypothetical protein